VKYRPIPGTRLEVSPICLGTMTFGSPVAEPEAIRLVHAALERGVNFIDTANIYEGYARVPGSSGGVAEEILAKALNGRRDKVVLATKLGMKVGQAPEDEGTSASAIRKHLDLSLKRLHTDHVDIYYLHRPDPGSPIAETLQALADEIHRGGICHYGVSNFSAAQLRELLEVADRHGLPRPVISQPPLSLLKQDALSGLLPLCGREHIASAPYQVLQGGLLTGKYRRAADIPPNSRKAEKDAWIGPLSDDLFDELEAIEKQAQEAGMPMAHYAIQWILNQPSVVSAVVGTKRINQLDEALAAVAGV